MTDVAAPNERDPEIHQAFLSLACAILCFRIARLQAQADRDRGGTVPRAARVFHNAP